MHLSKKKKEKKRPFLVLHVEIEVSQKHNGRRYRSGEAVNYRVIQQVTYSCVDTAGRGCVLDCLITVSVHAAFS